MDYRKMMQLIKGNNYEDALLVLEYLRKTHYPNIPKVIKQLIYAQIRADAVDKYFNYSDNYGNLGDWDISWKKEE